MQLVNDSQTRVKETEVKFELANDTLETMLNSMYCIRDQFSNVVKPHSFFEFPNSFHLMRYNMKRVFSDIISSLYYRLFHRVRHQMIIYLKMLMYK